MKNNSALVPMTFEHKLLLPYDQDQVVVSAYVAVGMPRSFILCKFRITEQCTFVFLAVFSVTVCQK